MPTTKGCPRCKLFRPLAQFSKNKRRSDGLALWCKPCMKEYSAEWRTRPGVKERTAQLSLARYHRLSSDEKLRIQQRRYHMGRHLLTTYGITMDDYATMVEAQGGGCAICQAPPREGRRLAVDHDHACCAGPRSCGQCVRGLLCTTCNVWLGFYENKDWVSKADEYLAREIAKRKNSEVV